MTTSYVPVTPGSGADIATYDISEDAVTKKIQRVSLNDLSGVAPTVRAGSSAVQSTDAALVVVARDANGNGRNSALNSAPVVPAYMSGQYVAASSSAQQLGTTGATTDYLDGLWIIPAAAAAGAVSIMWDGTNTRTVFAGGGTTALPTLAPFFIGFGFESGNSGGFKVTTGASVAVIAVGNFT